MSYQLAKFIDPADKGKLIWVEGRPTFQSNNYRCSYDTAGNLSRVKQQGEAFFTNVADEFGERMIVFRDQIELQNAHADNVVLMSFLEWVSFKGNIEDLVIKITGIDIAKEV